MSFRLISAILLTCLATFGGCSKYMSKLDKVLPDQRETYKQSKSLPDLEVPPDLTTDAIDDSLAVPDIDSSGAASFSEYEDRVQRQKDNRFYSSVAENSSITDIAGEQYFIVDSGMNNTWTVLSQFFSDKGYKLDLQDQELGVMETAWKTSGSSRDRFKAFVEPASSPGMTAIYLSRQAEENARGGWSESPRNVQLEYAAAEQIQNRLGGTPSSTTQQAAVSAAAPSDTMASTPVVADVPNDLVAEIIGAGGGKMYLAVNRSVDALWSSVGDVLSSSADITLTDQDRNNGTYSIEFSPESAKKKGIVKKLAFWKSDEFEMQVQLSAVGQNTEIVILDEDGDWDTSDRSDELLQRLRSGL